MKPTLLVPVAGALLSLYVSVMLAVSWHILDAAALLVLNMASLWSALQVARRVAGLHAGLFGLLCTALSLLHASHLAVGLSLAPVWQWINFGCYLTIGPVLLHLITRFPIERPGFSWYVRIAYLLMVALAAGGAVGWLGPGWNPDFGDAAQAHAVHLRTGDLLSLRRPGKPFMQVLMILAGLLVWDTQRRARRTGNHVARRQAGLLLLTLGSALIPIALFTPGVLPEGFHMIIHLWTGLYGVIPLGMAAALVWPTLYDPNDLLRRAMVYTGVGLMVLGLYMLLVRLLTLVADQIAPGIAHDSAVFTAAFTVALLVQPAKGWLQHQVDRLFFPDRLRFRTFLAETSHDLAITLNNTDLHNLTARELPARLGATGALLLVLDGAEQCLAPLTAQTPVVAPGHRVWRAAERSESPFVVDEIATADSLGLLAPVLGLPLHMGERLVGIYLIGARQSGLSYTKEELAQLSVFSHHLAVAVENGRSYRRIDELRRRAVDEVEERNSLAREIHDTLAQGLTGIALQLEVAEEALEPEPPVAAKAIGRALELTRSNLVHARRSVLELRAPLLGGESLPQALARMVKQAAEDQGAEGRFTLEGAYTPLSARVETTLYRIAQEALHNTVKYARARSLDLTLAVTATAACLTLTDDGVGFNSASTDRPGNLRGGFGLAGMRERAHLVGGRLSVESRPGQGTRVTLDVPLHPDGEGRA